MGGPTEFRIPVLLRETRGVARFLAPVRIGVPLQRGQVHDAEALEARDEQDAPLPFQGKALARWPDGSIKWLLVDVLCTMPPGSATRFNLGLRDTATTRPQTTFPVLRLREQATGFEIDAGATCVQVARQGSRLLDSVKIAGQQVLEQGLDVNLTDHRGRLHPAMLEELLIEESGPVSATVRLSGRFAGMGGRTPLKFVARLRCIAGSGAVQLDFKIWNPAPALHAGGLWDLGDPGSVLFRDLSLSVRVKGGEGRLHWHAEHGGEHHETEEAWVIYQDSSGGERWNSPNHQDRNGKLTVDFRGYRVLQQRGEGNPREVARGHRAEPGACLPGAHGSVTVAVRDFWQCFPTALRRTGNQLEVGIFPRESSSGFELQGGEQKRHTIHLDFAREHDPASVDRMQHAIEAAVDPQWVESTGAVAWFATPAADDDPRHAGYVNQVISADNGFAARREIIDEYGWRNFGDLYADHEAVKHTGPEPFISHYNNQYDFIHGACLHWLRTGDGRWRCLMDEAARHCIDIDLYRTQGDRPAFNGGLFWHTDHHKPAATCTHRTYSRANAGGGAYGGGPADEQDYASGLLHYYFATGDVEAAEAVRMLADWVIAMDDGARTPLAWLDSGPTGLASCTVEPGYHKPGRGAGNSINTLLEAFTLTAERRYLDKAEELIRRCIHPRDDVPALQLDEPEFRWSYLVFLQALGKYLHLKRGRGEMDAGFHHARESLLHYAAWMLEHEVPYKDVLHKVLLPTETWPAHDIRKCHVFHLAAEHSKGAMRERFAARAAFFHQRCIEDLLGFPSAGLTRPLVILTAYGTIHDHFRRHGHAAPCGDEPHGHDFGEPVAFVGQRERINARPLGRVLLIATAVMRLARERLILLRHRLGATRS